MKTRQIRVALAPWFLLDIKLKSELIKANWTTETRPVIQDHSTAAVHHSPQGMRYGRWPFSIYWVGKQRDFNLENVTFASVLARKWWHCSDERSASTCEDSPAVKTKTVLHRDTFFEADSAAPICQQTASHSGPSKVMTDRQLVLPALLFASVQGHRCHCHTWLSLLGP